MTQTIPFLLETPLGLCDKCRELGAEIVPDEAGSGGYSQRGGKTYGPHTCLVNLFDIGLQDKSALDDLCKNVVDL